jgi:hypothetical protein
MLKRPFEQIIRTQQTTQVSDIALKQTRGHRSRAIVSREIDLGHKVKDDVHDVLLLHEDRRIKGINRRQTPSIPRIREAVILRQEIIVGEGVSVVPVPREAELLDYGIGALGLVLREGGVVVVFALYLGVGLVAEGGARGVARRSGSDSGRCGSWIIVARLAGMSESVRGVEVERERCEEHSEGQHAEGTNE